MEKYWNLPQTFVFIVEYLGTSLNIVVNLLTEKGSHANKVKGPFSLQKQSKETWLLNRE